MAKRRSTSPDDTDDVDLVGLSVEEQVAQLRTELFTHVDTCVKASMDKTMDTTTRLAKNLEASTNARLNDIQANIDKLNSSQDKQQDEMANMRAQIEALNARLDLASQVPEQAPVVDTTNWQRPVDQTILRLNIPDPATKSELRKAILPWMEDAKCHFPDDVLLQGPDAGTRFVLKFVGPPGIAINRMRRARDLLRTADDNWREFPNYPTTNNGTSNCIYVDVDKNPEQLKRERDAKRLRAALASCHPGLNIRLNKLDGFITVDGKPLAMVVPSND